MQYKVPQNVDIEDKVIAGLTLRQFMFLMIAGSAILVLRYTLPSSTSFIFIPLSVFIGGFGIALAFVKINDRPLEVFLMSAVKTILTPPKRTWQKEIYVEESGTKKVATKKDEYHKKENVADIKSNLEKLAVIVDSGGAHNLETGTRSTNITSKSNSSTSKVEDILEKTEAPSERLSMMMNKFIKKNAKQKEELPISALAENNPEADKKNISYDSIQVTDEKELTGILQDIKREEKEKQEQLDAAVVKKFKRN